eukprot:1155935-Pelagomonas_calceolata.AAC.4
MVSCFGPCIGKWTARFCRSACFGSVQEWAEDNAFSVTGLVCLAGHCMQEELEPKHVNSASQLIAYRRVGADSGLRQDAQN